MKNIPLLSGSHSHLLLPANEESNQVVSQPFRCVKDCTSLDERTVKFAVVT